MAVSCPADTPNELHKQLRLSQLHHLRVALAAAGLHSDVDRLPDPDDRHHLATVGYRPDGPVDTGAAQLFPAIALGPTDRRRFSRQPVPPEHLAALAAAAHDTGAHLVGPAGPERAGRLLEIIGNAAAEQQGRPGYAAELRTWTHRYTAGRDGVPTDNLTVAVPIPPLRRFARGTVREAPGHLGATSDAAELLTIVTPTDGPLDRLGAGEATSALLLTATTLGLACTPLSQAVEVAAARAALADLLGVAGEPQLVIRVGWPARAAPALPPTPRRPLRAVVLPSRPRPPLPAWPTRPAP